MEAHPAFRNDALLDYCTAQRVHVTAYAPLGRGGAGGGASLLESDEATRAAAALGCTPAQALLRWALRRGTSVVPKSAHPARIAENATAAVPPVPPGVGEGGAASEACGAAEEERALAPLFRQRGRRRRNPRLRVPHRRVGRRAVTAAGRLRLERGALERRLRGVRAAFKRRRARRRVARASPRRLELPSRPLQRIARVVALALELF